MFDNQYFKKYLDDKNVDLKEHLEIEKLCTLDIDPKEFCETAHPLDPESFTLCIEAMKNPSGITFPEESLNQSLITCEADYQLYLQEVFKEDFAGLNIAFDSNVKDIEFIHKAVYPETLLGFSSDIILFPEHDNGAFCNEDESLDLQKINQQVAKAKKMITDFYSYDSIKEAIKILDNPNGYLAIISMTCPTEKEEVSAQVIGYHKLPSKPKTSSKQTEEAKAQATSTKCVSKDAEALISHHENQLAKNQGSTGLTMMSPGLMKTIPYSPPVFGNIRKAISPLCSDLGDRIKITAKGVFIDDKKVPKMSGMPMDMTSFDPNKVPAIARRFVETINTSAEEGQENIDGTYVLQLMGVQRDLLEISKAKRNSTRVASEGNYFAYCFNDSDWYEVQEGYVLDQFCNEERPPSLDQLKEEFSLYNEDMNELEEDDNDYEIEYEDTGSY